MQLLIPFSVNGVVQASLLDYFLMDDTGAKMETLWGLQDESLLEYLFLWPNRFTAVSICRLLGVIPVHSTRYVRYKIYEASCSNQNVLMYVILPTEAYRCLHVRLRKVARKANERSRSPIRQDTLSISWNNSASKASPDLYHGCQSRC